MELRGDLISLRLFHVFFFLLSNRTCFYCANKLSGQTLPIMLLGLIVHGSYLLLSTFLSIECIYVTSVENLFL